MVAHSNSPDPNIGVSMSELIESIDDFVERESYELAKVARDYYDAMQAGKVYLPKAALKAMARRWLYLASLDKFSPGELREYGLMFALFSLMYCEVENGSPSALAIDFCNLLAAKGIVLE